MGKQAIVLSGGGMFGPWQVGVWSVLEPVFQPQLAVGASVGAMNGYAIASGCTAHEMLEIWRRPKGNDLPDLPDTARMLIETRPLQLEFAVVLVKIPRLREEVFTGPDVTAEHLYGSCAVPLVTKPVKIGRSRYVDGGLLRSLPLRAAIDLGATQIIGLNALTKFPSPTLRPLVHLFQGLFPRVQVPEGVTLVRIDPSAEMGSLRDACFWNARNVERFYQLGVEDGRRGVESGAIPAPWLRSITG
jgi:predicted acylesterase/phospholipase RssA